MSVKTAAIEVLRKAQSSLHAKAITEQIVAAGLWQPSGKTPEATVSAQLYSDIKKNGDKSPFVKVAHQTFALGPWARHRLAFAACRIRNRQRFGPWLGRRHGRFLFSDESRHLISLDINLVSLT